MWPGRLDSKFGWDSCIFGHRAFNKFASDNVKTCAVHTMSWLRQFQASPCPSPGDLAFCFRKVNALPWSFRRKQNLHSGAMRNMKMPHQYGIASKLYIIAILHAAYSSALIENRSTVTADSERLIVTFEFLDSRFKRQKVGFYGPAGSTFLGTIQHFAGQRYILTKLQNAGNFEMVLALSLFDFKTQLRSFSVYIIFCGKAKRSFHAM